MKKLVLIAIISSTLLFSSCSNYTHESSTVYSEMKEDSTVESISESSSYFVSDYCITPLDVDLSFDDILTAWDDYLGVDILNLGEDDAPNYCVQVDNDFIVYTRDYQAYLEVETRPDAEGVVWYYPMESEYHQLRRLFVDGVGINELENEQWAEAYYRQLVDTAYLENNELDESSLTDGYCFVDSTSDLGIRTFCAYYYWENYTMVYRYTFDRSDSVDYYRNYVAVCNELGLPTCDQITEEILG